MKKIIFMIMLTFCIFSCSTENPIAPKTENTSELAFVDGYVTLYDDPIDAMVNVYYNGNLLGGDGTDEDGYYRVEIGSGYNGCLILVQCTPALKYGLDPWTISVYFYSPFTHVNFPYPRP